jgi:hypothetical protein
MNGPSAVDQVDRIVLARLLLAGEKGATTSELKKSLEPLLGHRFASGALTERLTEALGRLESAGLAQQIRKGKTERGIATPEGTRHALEFLGLDHLPPKATWAQIMKSYLAARALGLTPPRDKAVKQFSGVPGFKAALLKARFDLPLGDYPTFDQALDALAWKLLGFEAGSGTKFTLAAAKAALIGRALDGRVGIDPKADPKKEATKLLARRVGARQSDKDELRLAALRQWIDGAPTAPAPAPAAAPVPVPPPAPPPPIDLDAFARRVVEAARSTPTGRFGDDKVFVSHVFRVLSVDPRFAAMGLDGFKQRLAEANNARRLDLSRADMVEAMNPEDVAQSRVAYLGAEFHFIRIPSP